MSFLDEKGAPGIVQKAKILFPLSQIGAITESERRDVMSRSAIGHKYDQMIDRESAYEMLMAESESLPTETEDTKPAKAEKGGKKKQGILQKVLKAILTAVTATLGTIVGSAASDAISGKKTKKKTSAGQRIVKNSTSAATRTITRELTRDILGNLIK